MKKINLRSLSNIFEEVLDNSFTKNNSYKKKYPSQRTEYNKLQKKTKSSFNFLSLIKHWEEIVGPRSAKNTIPLRMINKTLIILTNHSAYSSSLSFIETPIKNKIFTIFPELKNQIKDLKYQVNSSFFDKKYNLLQAKTKTEIKQQQYSNHQYSPKYQAAKKNANNLFSEIKDSDIKEKLISIYLQSSE